MPLGQTGGSLAAAQNPFLRTPFAGVTGRLHVMVPVQHSAPQFQVLILTSAPFYISAENKSALLDCLKPCQRPLPLRCRSLVSLFADQRQVSLQEASCVINSPISLNS